MRQRKEMSQKDLARELGTSQNAIYRLESPKAGKPNISTLEKIAAYFGVGLIVRFAPVSEVVDWTMNMSQQSIDIPDFDNDLGFMERKAADVATVAGYGNNATEVTGRRQGRRIAGKSS
jgi:transcriptional regulator with XRE-family HTH domain